MPDHRNTNCKDDLSSPSLDHLETAILDSISAHVALLDESGFILGTNRAWRRFATDNAGTARISATRMNYLAVCDAAAVNGDEDARAAAQGIRSVMKGDTTEFTYDYPCHSPAARHWFYMRAIRLAGSGPLRIIISHEEITALKEMQEELQKSKDAIEEQKQRLVESNIALKVLLKQRELDKHEHEQKIIKNIKESIFPYLQKLKLAPLRSRDKTLVETIEKHLKEIASPLLQRLSNVNILLTPQEIQIASLVKDGRSSKEIAELLNVSETTVHFHRKNLRYKLGLKKKAANLRSHLMSME